MAFAERLAILRPLKHRRRQVRTDRSVTAPLGTKDPHFTPTPEARSVSNQPPTQRSRSAQLDPKRRALFIVIALVAVPAVLLLALELGLRLCGYGYETTFFKPLRIGTEDYLVENDKFGWRFFPPEISRSPTPIRMPAHKSPGTYRIFLLGESAASGDPEPAYGMGRYLQVLLQERYPATRFEVVPAAMTAINSHAVLPIARECASHEGDLWVVYMGNNEMAGPFGAATVFGCDRGIGNNLLEEFFRLAGVAGLIGGFGFLQLLIAFAPGLQPRRVGLHAVNQVLPFLGGEILLARLGFAEEHVGLLVATLPLCIDGQVQRVVGAR